MYRLQKEPVNKAPSVLSLSSLCSMETYLLIGSQTMFTAWVNIIIYFVLRKSWF